jgi:hypothetical protein
LKRNSLLVFPVLLILFLASCGTGSNDPEPTVAPTATVLPTLPPGAITVGNVIVEIEAAWAGIGSWRATTWSTESPDLSTPASGDQVTIEEVVLPSSRHLAQVTGGVVVDEQLLVDGRVYMKGSLVQAAIAPNIDTNTWVEVDPAAASSSTSIAPQVAYLTSPITSPFASVSPETRALQAVPAGDITVEGRTCRRYTFGTADEGIAYELALDERNLPCRLVQSGGGYSNVTTYAFDVPGLVLAAPAIATPPAD